MKIATLSITAGGCLLRDKICDLLEQATVLEKPSKNTRISQLFADNWEKYDAFICVMAAGIVVRAIAPLIQNKNHDPAVLVVDEKGRNVISLLSGHIGGGNQLTRLLAEKIGAEPVITTSSDNLGLIALDLWAQHNRLSPPPKAELTAVTAKLVNQGYLHIFTDVAVADLPHELKICNDPHGADIAVTNRTIPSTGAAFFRPRNLVVGIGCNRGTALKEFESSLNELFLDNSLHLSSIKNFASIDKKNDEQGLLEFAQLHGLEIDFFPSSKINKLNNLEISFAALKAIGAIGVAEPSALLSANSNILLCRKRKWKNITMAIAQVPFLLSGQAPDQLTI